MKKGKTSRIIATVIAIIIVLAMIAATATAAFADDEVPELIMENEEQEPAVLTENADPGPLPWSGSGTENDPYKIASSDDWDALSEYVNNGNSTEGMYFLLTDDIDVMTMLGPGPDFDNDENLFMGVFDGGSHTINCSIDVASNRNMTAPFSKIRDAEIKHLKVTGTVRGGCHCSGLVGRATGTNKILDCVVSTDITASGEYCGGILAHGVDSDTTIEGCVFCGSITGNNTNAGAIWGASENAKATIKNCLETGSYNGVVLDPVGRGSTTRREVVNTYFSISNYGYPPAYWNTGKLKHILSADEGITIDPGEYTEYEVSGIKGYSTGMEYGGVLYVGENEIISVTLPEPPEGKAYTCEPVDYVTALGNGTEYRIWMPTCDLNITLLEDFATVTIDSGGDDSILITESFVVPNGTDMEDVFYLVTSCFNDDKYHVEFNSGGPGFPYYAILGWENDWFGPAFYVGFKKNYADLPAYVNSLYELLDKTIMSDMTAYVIWNEPIKEITVGVHTPKPGDAIGENPPEFEIESDECFILFYDYGAETYYECYWMDENYNRITEGEFQEGQKYYAVVAILPEIGYYFPLNEETGAFDFDITTRGGTLVDGEYDVGVYLAIEVTAGNEDALTYDLTKSKVTLSKTEFAYNGKVQKPTIKTVNGQKLKEGTDYTVKWSNSSSTNAGLYKVTITGKGKYHGKTTATYRICFSDVPMSHSYSSAVYWASDAGIAAGYTGAKNGLFGVSDDITRGQVMMFLWRAAGKPEPAGTGKDFTDVPSTNNFYKAIKWGVEQGITGGYTGARKGQFGPNDNCTRGQIAMFLWRYAKSPKPAPGGKTFSDVPKSNNFYTAIMWASGAGVTAGYKDGTFGVNKTCTRGQCVTFLYRMLG